MKRLLLIIGSMSIIVLLYFSMARKPSESPQMPTHQVTEKPEEIRLADVSEVVDPTPSNFHPEAQSENQDSHVDPDRDYLLWSKRSDELEAAWNMEIYSHIQYVDRERANLLYEAYKKERLSYLEPQDKSLEDTLNDLSRLNGESIENMDAYRDEQIEHTEFIIKLQKIFRHHYGYIETQRKIFLDAHENK